MPAIIDPIPFELRRLARLGFSTFVGPRSWDLNVVGVRGANRDQSGSPFDDIFLVMYRNALGLWVTDAMPCTTDPTEGPLMDPINADGTAIVLEGQYPKLWKLGLHKGRPGMVQAAPIDVARDKNRDRIITIDPKTRQHGDFDINFHDGSGRLASAGCQVVPTQKHVDHVRGLVMEQDAAGLGGTVTYTLVSFERLYG